MDFDGQKSLENLNISAEWVGLRYFKERTHSRYIRDEKPQANGKNETKGVMVEVMVNGQLGYCGTNRLEQSSIQMAAETAYQQAQKASLYALHKFSPDIRPQAIGKYESPVNESLDNFRAGDLNDLLIKVCQSLKVSPQIVKTSALAEISETEQHFVSSNGSSVWQKYFLVATSYSATAKDGNIVQTRSDNGMMARCYQAGMEVFDLDSILLRANQIGGEALALLTADQCPNLNTTLVLAPDQMMLQIHESVGHPLELDRILGDERNYAGSSFVKLSDFGNLVYGSPLMNVTFDPTVKGQFASYAFDDGGMKATKEHLIKDGLLVRGLGSLESQTRAKLAGVANFRANSWNRAPIDRMANLNLEAGQSSFEEIISSIEQGIYMQTNRSWSIDDYRHKFQFGCEYARLIENGKLTKTLRNPNYRGVTNDFWHNLIQVGDNSTWEMYGTPYCGKGEPNQVIKVGHASPVCAFKDIEVFGGVG
jgi:predicted Zn-dependent protease